MHYLHCFSQNVIYKNGIMDTCRLSLSTFEKSMSIKQSYNGTDIHYRKDGVWIYDLSEFDSFFDIIHNLQDLDKRENVLTLSKSK